MTCSLFVDILTPLPALGIDFDIREGKGPQIANPIRSIYDVSLLKSFHDVDKQLPFVRSIFQV